MLRNDWILTFTGKKFYPLYPSPDDICIMDIAQSLGNQCRFTGHTDRFYSVAEHCVLMYEYFLKSAPPEAALRALLHDASEAYLTDIPTPLKQRPEFAFYRSAEKRLQEMIFVKFGIFPFTEPDSMIKSLDKRMLNAEARQMMKSHPDWEVPKEVDNIPFQYWDPEEASRTFLHSFETITSELYNRSKE